MFIVGLFVHLIFLFSIFDIYFKSPVVNNVVPYQPHHAAPADRLVLVVLDGLRAESFVNYTAMTYLRSVANTYGRWGISSTRVPTESRPCHIALIAGFYEDPSAVAKGWKDNPVDFDSVFNQTTYTWCWGSYSTLKIFTKGNKDDHIFTINLYNYDAAFSTDNDKTLVDAWVFDKVKTFFQIAKRDEVLFKKLHKNKIAFFMHLLAADLSGHTHKPKSKSFLRTIKFADEGIKEMERIIRDFYNDDGRTTFLITADHGMTDWGVHGAGDDHETKTPYVLWGAGIQKVKAGKLDTYTLNMSLEHRLDLDQIDLTPMMSTILSIPVPVNSVGQLSSELLNMSLADKAKAIYSNSRQLASQYNKKRSDVESNAITMLYWPCERFTKAKYQEMIDFTEKLEKDGEYERLILFSEEIIELSLVGLNYYHNYYQLPLLILVTMSFLGWILCLLKVLSEQNINTPAESSCLSRNSIVYRRKYKLIFNLAIAVMCISSFCLVFVQNLPIQYNLYLLLPNSLWWFAFASPNVWIQIIRQLKTNRGTPTVCIEVLCYTMGSMAMGLSFTYRWMLSIPLLGMALWPFFSSSRNHITKPILLAWPASCIILSLFSYMPVVGKEVFVELVITAGVIWFMVLAVYIWKVLLPLYKDHKKDRTEIVLTTLQMAFLILSLQNIYVQSKRFKKGTQVSYIDQTLARIIAVSSLVLPLAFTRRMVSRLVAINTSILNFYLLLSVSHEGLFMVTLIFNVICWIFIEFRLLHLGNMKASVFYFNKENLGEASRSFTTIERSISNQDFRRAFFFIAWSQLLYIILAFFGTGNIASLNSFEVRWVTCFVTSYRPIIIAGLILLKTLSPFLSVAVSFRAVQYLTKAPTGLNIIIVLIYSNIIGIQLLYYVKNTGSWLEIGTSISHFVIVQVITLFIVLINQIAKILTEVNILNFTNKVFIYLQHMYVRYRWYGRC